MLTKEELSAKCDQFWEVYNSTMDLPGNKALFADIVYIAIEYIPADDIAREFEIAESTIRRWSKGAACPHPLLQRKAVEYIAKRLRE